MSEKTPVQIKAAAIIFLILGILYLILALILLAPGTKISYGGVTQVYGLSIPTNFYNPFIGILLALFCIFIIESVLLFKLIKFGFWLGVVLSILLLLAFPTGTILGVVNLYLLFKSKSKFYNI